MKEPQKNQAASALAKSRWAKTTPEERSRYAKKIVGKRKWRPVKKLKAK